MKTINHSTPKSYFGVKHNFTVVLTVAKYIIYDDVWMSWSGWSAYDVKWTPAQEHNLKKQQIFTSSIDFRLIESSILYGLAFTIVGEWMRF